ncbi:MAG: sulfotransferase, partial [Hyphomicrobiales bacterium]
MQGIIWLASYPKSGNTWLRAFLANLFSGEADPVSFERMSNFIPSEALSAWYLDMFGKDFDVTNDRAVTRNRAKVQARLTAGREIPVFLKTHSYLGQERGHNIINLNVTIGAVYIVRNPLDVVVSAAPHFNLTLDQTIELMADKDMKSQGGGKLVFEKPADWSTNVRSWTKRSHPSLLVLKYEDLLQDPKTHFTKLTRFIQLNKSEKEIKRAIENSSFKSLQTLEQKDGFSERPEHAKSFFRKGETEQWR